jgi:hypothetical protein
LAGKHLDDEAVNPIDFAVQCALAYADEYLAGRPDLKRKINVAVREIAELRTKAWQYDELVS